MIRSLYSVCVLLLVTSVLTLGVLILRLLTGSRRRAYSMVRLWGRCLVWIFGVRVTRIHAETVDFSRPVIYLSNHLSQADIPILMSAIPAGLSFIAKQDLAQIPFLSWSMRLVGMVFIRRGYTQEAIQRLNEAAREIPPDMNFIVFPEGSRSPTGGRILHPLKKGGFYLALASGRPIQPVALMDSEHIMPRGSVAVYPGRVRLAFGRQIAVSPSDSVDDLMQRYREEMERLLAEAGD